MVFIPGDGAAPKSGSSSPSSSNKSYASRLPEEDRVAFEKSTAKAASASAKPKTSAPKVPTSAYGVPSQGSGGVTEPVLEGSGASARPLANSGVPVNSALPANPAPANPSPVTAPWFDGLPGLDQQAILSSYQGDSAEAAEESSDIQSLEAKVAELEGQLVDTGSSFRSPAQAAPLAAARQELQEAREARLAQALGEHNQALESSSSLGSYIPNGFFERQGEIQQLASDLGYDADTLREVGDAMLRGESPADSGLPEALFPASYLEGGNQPQTLDDVGDHLLTTPIIGGVDRADAVNESKTAEINAQIDQAIEAGELERAGELRDELGTFLGATGDSQRYQELVDDGASPYVAGLIANGELEQPTPGQMSAVVDAMQEGLSPQEAGLDPALFPLEYTEAHERQDEVDRLEEDRNIVASEEDRVDDAEDGLSDLLRHENQTIEDLSFREERAVEELLEELENDPNADPDVVDALEDLVDGDSVDDLTSTDERRIKELADELEVREDALEAQVSELNTEIDQINGVVDTLPLVAQDGSVDTFEAIAAVRDLGFPGSDEWAGAELADHWPPESGSDRHFDPASVTIASELVSADGDTAEAFFNGIGADGTAQLASVVQVSGLYEPGEGPLNTFATAAAEQEQAGNLNFTGADLVSARQTVGVPGMRGTTQQRGVSSAVLLAEADFSAEFDVSAAEQLLAENNSGGGQPPVTGYGGGDAANLALAAVATEGPDAAADLVARLDDSGNLNHLISPDRTPKVRNGSTPNPILAFEDGSSGVTALLAVAGSDPAAAQTIIEYAATDDTLPVNAAVGIDAVLAQNVTWLYDQPVDLPGVGSINPPLSDEVTDAAVSNVFANGSGALVLSAADEHIATVANAALADHPTGTELTSAISDAGMAAEPLGEIQGLAFDVGHGNAEAADERINNAKTALGWVATGASIATVPLGGWGGVAVAGGLGLAGTYGGDALFGPANNTLNFVTQQFENGFVMDDHLANHIHTAAISQGYVPGFTVADNGAIVPEAGSGLYGQGFNPMFLPDPYDANYDESWLAQVELVDADGNSTGQTLGDLVNTGSGGLIANYNDAVVENSDVIAPGDVNDIFGG